MSEPVTAVLLLSCADQRGLVAAVSQFLYEHSGNIIHADQHTDPEEGVFLQRVEWELEGFAVERDEIAPAFRPIAERFGMTWELHFSDYVPRMALFASTLPHCLYDLLARWRMSEFRAEVSIVVSNHDELRPIVDSFNVPFRTINLVPGAKEEIEAEVCAELQSTGVDVIILARYMQLLGDVLLSPFRNKIINIHHSFLPAFAGARPYHQAHERGVKIIGATAHYITSELDQGPIIAQDVVQVSHRDSVADLVRKGRDLEKIVLARAVDLHLRHRVVVYGNKTVVFD